MDTPPLCNGDRCEVVAGMHSGKTGIVSDMKTIATGAVTISVVQDNGVRFKRPAKNARCTTRRSGS